LSQLLPGPHKCHSTEFKMLFSFDVIKSRIWSIFCIGNIKWNELRGWVKIECEICLHLSGNCYQVPMAKWVTEAGEGRQQREREGEWEREVGLLTIATACQAQVKQSTSRGITGDATAFICQINGISFGRFIHARMSSSSYSFWSFAFVVGMSACARQIYVSGGRLRRAAICIQVE